MVSHVSRQSYAAYSRLDLEFAVSFCLFSSKNHLSRSMYSLGNNHYCYITVSMASKMTDGSQGASMEAQPSSFRNLAISTPPYPQKFSQTLTSRPQSANFSSLPSEIRQQIWLLTLAPRLIYLHSHKTLSSLAKGNRHKSLRTITSIQFSHSLYSPDCTPASHFRAAALPHSQHQRRIPPRMKMKTAIQKPQK